MLGWLGRLLGWEDQEKLLAEDQRQEAEKKRMLEKQLQQAGDDGFKSGYEAAKSKLSKGEDRISFSAGDETWVIDLKKEVGSCKGAFYLVGRDAKVDDSTVSSILAYDGDNSLLKALADEIGPAVRDGKARIERISTTDRLVLTNGSETILQVNNRPSLNGEKQKGTIELLKLPKLKRLEKSECFNGLTIKTLEVENLESIKGDSFVPDVDILDAPLLQKVEVKNGFLKNVNHGDCVKYQYPIVRSPHLTSVSDASFKERREITSTAPALAEARLAGDLRNVSTEFVIDTLVRYLEHNDEIRNDVKTRINEYEGRNLQAETRKKSVKDRLATTVNVNNSPETTGPYSLIKEGNKNLDEITLQVIPKKNRGR